MLKKCTRSALKFWVAAGRLHYLCCSWDWSAGSSPDISALIRLMAFPANTKGGQVEPSIFMWCPKCFVLFWNSFRKHMPFTSISAPTFFHFFHLSDTFYCCLPEGAKKCQVESSLVKVSIFSREGTCIQAFPSKYKLSLRRKGLGWVGILISHIRVCWLPTCNRYSVNINWLLSEHVRT